MKIIEEIWKTEEYQQLPLREQMAVELAAVDLSRPIGRGILIEVNKDKPFDTFGFRKACAAVGVNANMPEEPTTPDGKYRFNPTRDPKIRPEMIKPRNQREELAHEAAVLRRQEESRNKLTNDLGSIVKPSR